MLGCALQLLFYAIVIFIAICVFFRLFMRLTSGKCNITGSLKGKVFFITGANGGIGRETARELARHQATVFMACRSLSKAHVVADRMRKKTRNPNIEVLHCDLNSLKSVRKCAEEFLSRNIPLHCLINNAGLFADKQRKLTEDGLEVTMQSNHFGHFLLTNLLLDCIKKSVPSRIVNVSSLAHFWGTKFDIENINYDRSSSYNWGLAYADSKLANVLFTRELSLRLEGTGVTTNCLHPGAVQTRILKGFPWPIAVLHSLLLYAIKTSAEGAQTSLYLATSPDVENVSGEYFADCKPAAVYIRALDRKLAIDLWKLSEKLTGLSG